MKVELSRVSYEKILSQSMKYPMSFVDGVLIGYLSGKDTLIVTDSFPLTHGPKLPLVITIGMQYVQAYCDILNRSNSPTKCEIIGFYSSSRGEERPGSGYSKAYFDIISEKLLYNNNYSIHITVHDQNLLSGNGLSVCLLRNKQQLPYTIENSTGHETKNLTKYLEYYNMNDFEDHLSNSKLKLINNLFLNEK